jgi:hypothetical protein
LWPVFYFLVDSTNTQRHSRAIHAPLDPARFNFAIFFAISMRSESARLSAIGIYHQTFLKSADITIEHK